MARTDVGVRFDSQFTFWGSGHCMVDYAKLISIASLIGEDRDTCVAKVVHKLFESAACSGCSTSFNKGHLKAYNRDKRTLWCESLPAATQASFAIASIDAFRQFRSFSDLQRAVDILKWVESHLGKADKAYRGTYCEQYGESFPILLDTQILMFEALLELAEEMPGPLIRQRASLCGSAIEQHFISANHDISVSPFVLDRIAPHGANLASEASIFQLLTLRERLRRLTGNFGAHNDVALFKWTFDRLNGDSRNHSFAALCRLITAALSIGFVQAEDATDRGFAEHLLQLNRNLRRWKTLMEARDATQSALPISISSLYELVTAIHAAEEYLEFKN